MMQRFRSLFFFAKVIVIAAVFFAAAFDAPQSRAAATVTAPSMLEAVPVAKKLLADEMKTLEKQPPSASDIILAVWNKDDATIAIYHGVKKGVTVTLKEAAPFSVKATSASSATWPYTTTPSSYVVVGVVSSKGTVVRVKKKKVTQYRRVESTPLSDQFYKPEVYAAGSDYLSDIIGSAFTELATANIRSRAFPNKLVTEVVDPYLIKAIVVSEHTSDKSLLKGDAEDTLETFLVRLAVDRGTAFNTSISSAGAAGLVQFIAPTYKATAKNNPAYKLKADFVAGMSDHKNAVKAEIALLDADLASLPANVKAQYVANNFQTVAALLGASYNGGSLRVQRALDYWGDDWMKPHTAEVNSLAGQVAALKKKIPGMRSAVFAAKTKAIQEKRQSELNSVRAQYNKLNAKLALAKKSTLKAETVGYIAKIGKAYDMFTAGMYATPHAPSGALPTPLLAMSN